MCPERVLHVSHTEGLPPPRRASTGATWGLTSGFPFLSSTGLTAHAGSAPRPAAGPPCSSRTEGFHRALRGSDSLSRQTTEAARLCALALPSGSHPLLTTTFSSSLNTPLCCPRTFAHAGPQFYPGHSLQRLSFGQPFLASHLEPSRNYPLVYPVSPPSPSLECYRGTGGGI